MPDYHFGCLWIQHAVSHSSGLDSSRNLKDSGNSPLCFRLFADELRVALQESAVVYFGDYFDPAEGFAVESGFGFYFEVGCFAVDH